jgi:predicted transport protein
LDVLEELDFGEIDLRSYSKVNGDLFDRFQLHESTYLVRRRDTVERSRYQVLAVGRLARYQVLAVGRLASPFAVSLYGERRQKPRGRALSTPLSSNDGPSIEDGARSPVSFEDHVAYADPSVRPVLRELRTRIKALESSNGKINENVTMHQRITYRVARDFVEVKVQKKRILVRFFGLGVSDPKTLVTNVPTTHGWPHDKQIAVDSVDLIDYVMTFVKASYRSELTTRPAR